MVLVDEATKYATLVAKVGVCDWTATDVFSGIFSSSTTDSMDSKSFPVLSCISKKATHFWTEVKKMWKPLKSSTKLWLSKSMLYWCVVINLVMLSHYDRHNY